jgi:D-arabinose 5-phosphate isomerase GutQ
VSLYPIDMLRVLLVTAWSGETAEVVGAGSEARTSSAGIFSPK